MKAPAEQEAVMDLMMGLAEQYEELRQSARALAQAWLEEAEAFSTPSVAADTFDRCATDLASAVKQLRPRAQE